jgi:UDP-N-acetylmuramate dehydrogenase
MNAAPVPAVAPSPPAPLWVAHASLATHNTFRVAAKARWLVEIADAAQLPAVFADERTAALGALVLGGGSNLLFTADLERVVVVMNSRGIRVVRETNEQVEIEVAAGEPWHGLVAHCLEQGWHGLENLALIPGTVGAAPVQNIGAYGLELAEVFESLEAFDTQTGAMRVFKKADCEFAYRDSVFKRAPGRYVIASVRLLLTRAKQVNLSYAELARTLTARGAVAPTPQDVFNAVVALRSAKLPDPARLGNAGSFFMNPIVSDEVCDALQVFYPDLVAYPQGSMRRKLSAGWLIDRAGWKGVRRGDAGVHTQHALVLVNHGVATGAEIIALAQEIQKDVAQKFGVQLQIEPQVF